MSIDCTGRRLARAAPDAVLSETEGPIMAIRFQCRCGTRYTVTDEHAGQVVTCKQCNRKLRVPASPAPRQPPRVEAETAQFCTEDAYEVESRSEEPEYLARLAPRATSTRRKKYAGGFLSRLPGGSKIWIAIPAAVAGLLAVLSFFSIIMAGIAMFVFMIAGLGLLVGGMVWSLAAAFRQGIGTFVGFLIAWVILTLHLVAGGMRIPQKFPAQLTAIGAGGVMFGHMIRRRDEFGRPALCCLASLPPLLLGGGAAYLAQRHEGDLQTKVQDFVRRAEAAKYRNSEKHLYFDAPFMWEQAPPESGGGEIVRFKQPYSNVLYMLARTTDGGSAAKDIEAVLEAARAAPSKRDSAASVNKAEIVTIGNRKAARLEIALPGTNQELLAFHFLRDGHVVTIEYFTQTGSLQANMESFEQSAKTIRLDAGGLALVPSEGEKQQSPAIAVPYFRDPGPGTVLEPGVRFQEIDIGAANRLPGPTTPTPKRIPEGTLAGFDGKLWLYLPDGEHAAQSLPCVLIAAAGSTCITGKKLSADDRAEHLPYVRAGFAVVAYELDGDVAANATEPDVKLAVRTFKWAKAGLVNARIAIEFVLKKVPQVDPERVFTAGHSSAATTALLFAEHEPRLKGCAAYAPVVDVAKHCGPLIQQLERTLTDLREFAVRSSPQTFDSNLNCPVFLFHAHDDSTVPVSNSVDFASRLERLGKNVTLVTVPTGNHYNSMIQQGIPRGVDWMKGLAAAKAGQP